MKSYLKKNANVFLHVDIDVNIKYIRIYNKAYKYNNII